MFILNINNKSAPKKLNNRILKNKYYIQSPPYMKGIERYHENINKLGYDYRNNYRAILKIQYSFCVIYIYHIKLNQV